MNDDEIQICGLCDDVIDPPLEHNCIRGITDNINKLRLELFQFQRELLKMVAK